MQLATLLGALTSPLLYVRIHGLALTVGGILSLAGLAATAPALRRGWAGVVGLGRARQLRGGRGAGHGAERRRARRRLRTRPARRALPGLKRGRCGCGQTPVRPGSPCGARPARTLRWNQRSRPVSLAVDLCRQALLSPRFASERDMATAAGQRPADREPSRGKPRCHGIHRLHLAAEERLGPLRGTPRPGTSRPRPTE